MEKVLFVTNELFINEQQPEGGVRLCTYDFIKLLKFRYEVVILPLQFNRSFFYRVNAKLGIAVFEDYKKSDYKKRLSDCIRSYGINKVFINLSSASDISKAIKEEFNDNVKVILFSHGNESGDFLHQSVRFKKFMPLIQRVTSAWRLGKVLQSELSYRIHYFDLVLTVSEIEFRIEQWLGAKNIYFIPRIFSREYVPWNPSYGRLGFLSDLSHYPNYYGLLTLCEAIVENGMTEVVHIRIAGKGCVRMKELLSKYKFLHSTGYLDEDALKQEVSTWMYFLNPVFYYSKGVSTKLAKGMNWGLPVLSTEAGNRGYIFKQGGPVTFSTTTDFLKIIGSRLAKRELLIEDRLKVMQAVEAFEDYTIIVNDLCSILEQL
jgi:hypothetical protein